MTGRGKRHWVLAGTVASIAVAAPAQAAPVCTPVAGSIQCVYSTVGADAFVVPPGVTEATFEAFGAQGGGSFDSDGGLGGYGASVLPVTPGETLTVNVGGAGGDGGDAAPDGAAGGFNGGGEGAPPEGGGGGGASDVRRGAALTDRLVVGGGGGGAAGLSSAVDGGDGGGLEGFAGDGLDGGRGGNQDGTQGSGDPGAGGDGMLLAGGGGGGGFYGGAGGGHFSGGGGGSGFGQRLDRGVREGDGMVVVTYVPAPERTDRCAPEPDLVGCWHFDEDPGAATAVDSSGFGNDGTYFGGPLLGVPGVDGTAVGMDGADDHVRVPDSASLDVGDSFTLEGWIRRDTDGRVHQLFNKGGKGFHLVVMSRFDGNQVWLRKAGSSTLARSAGGVPADGEFHHVAATRNGPGSTALYIDGAPQAVEHVAPTKGIEDTAFPLYFSATAAGNVVGGALDEYAVHDRALTPEEIAVRAGRGAAPPQGQQAATGAARASAAGSSGTRTTSSCADVGTADSGITAISAGGLPCALARSLAAAGPAAVARHGLWCAVVGEDWTGAVTRISRACTGPGGAGLRYTTLG